DRSRDSAWRGTAMDYRKDDVRRRLVYEVGGALTADDAMRRLEQQAADGAWAYTSLIDMRMVTAWLTFEQMATVTRRAAAITRDFGPRGSVAIVVANQALIPVGQAHAIVRGEAGTAGFFRDFKTAERWLETDSQTDDPI